MSTDDFTVARVSSDRCCTIEHVQGETLLAAAQELVRAAGPSARITQIALERIRLQARLPSNRKAR